MVKPKATEPPPVPTPEVATWATATPPDPSTEVPTWATATPPEPADDFPPELVDEVRSAEASAQRSVCNVPDGDLPAELAEALELRVKVNLAQHNGRTVVRVGSKDPEVRRLEAPWSKRRP